jgi:hypothetical protein
MHFEVQISRLDKLYEIMKDIEKIRGVASVQRVRG